MAIFGKTTFDLTGVCGGNTVYASRYQCTLDGVTSKATCYCKERFVAVYVCKAAIYSDNAGDPDALLGVSDEVTLPTNYTWLDFPNLVVNVTAGTYYWLAILSTGVCFGYNAVAAALAYVGAAYPNFPNPFNKAGNLNYELSIYATYTPTALVPLKWTPHAAL